MDENKNETINILDLIKELNTREIIKNVFSATSYEDCKKALPGLKEIFSIIKQLEPHIQEGIGIQFTELKDQLKKMRQVLAIKNFVITLTSIEISLDQSPQNINEYSSLDDRNWKIISASAQLIGDLFKQLSLIEEQKDLVFIGNMKKRLLDTLSKLTQQQT